MLDQTSIGRFETALDNIDGMFNRCLYNNLREAVIFLDSRLRVTLWNRTAEQMTGLRSANIIDKEWTPSQINLRDRHGVTIHDRDCPVREALADFEPKFLAASLIGRGGRKLAVEVRAIPVMDHEGQVFGALILLQDQSAQLDLEQQVLSLYAHATRDQLTGVANRTYFERILDARVAEARSKGSRCSLVVADIDFFKTINDTFNHHTGDQALMTFAKLIQQNISVDDVVARFGGEEFMILFPGCDVDQAMQKAEEIRKIIEQTPLAAIDGK